MTKDISKSDHYTKNSRSFQPGVRILRMQTLISVLLKPSQVMTWQFSNINTALFVKKRFLQTKNSARIDVKVSMKREERKLEGLSGSFTGLLPSLLVGS